MKFTVVLILGQVVCVIALAVTQFVVESATISATTTKQVQSTVGGPSQPKSTRVEFTTTIQSWTSFVTIAPLSRNPLQLRQRCFNDQGFSVDCATWTGYYYTWGGAGHPYAGGPGDGSSGSGSTNNNGITGIISEANKLQILLVSSAVALATMCMLILM